jgi:hypothetical protein
MAANAALSVLDQDNGRAFSGLLDSLQAFPKVDSRSLQKHLALLAAQLITSCLL